MNKKIEKLINSDIYPIKTVIIGRCEGTLWSPMILKDVDDTMVPFHVYSADGETYGIEMIATYEGNESALDTDDDVFDLWDYERLKD